jgi:hypothetical protein
VKIEQAIDAFERAVNDAFEEGAIPLYSDDREEQRMINAARRRIRSNYTRARNRLLKMLEATNG